jgi:hypothetical protein
MAILKEQKNAILITSNEDVNILSDNDELVGIACDYPIIQMNESANLQYFLDYPKEGIDLHKLVGEVISGWYRDDEGVDAISKSDVGIGALLQYRLAIEFSSTLRYYFAFKEHVPKYRKILISKNIPMSLLMAAKYFDDRIEYFCGSSAYEAHITSAPNRGIIRNPPIHKYFSILLRLIQRPFLRYIRNNVLVINDWTYRKIDNPDCLNINTFNPLRSFCLRSGNQYLKEAEKYFPLKLVTEHIKHNVERIISKYDLDDQVQKDIVDLYINVVATEYNEARSRLINTYCSYKEMFYYYSPSMVVVPGYAHSFCQTIFGIAKSKHVPTVFILDGYPFYIDKYLFQKDRAGRDQMVDYFGASGEYADILYKRVFGEDIIKTIKMSPPIIDTHKSVSNRDNAGSVLVLFSYGMIQNPDCRWDQRYQYVLDVISVLVELKASKIAVKMKIGIDVGKSEEFDLMRLLLDYHGYSDIEMISGELSEYLNNAKCIVGQLGTAIIESIYRDIPYYVYEPYSLGITNEMIANSMLEREMISRDIFELMESISDENHVVLKKNKIFNATQLAKINFKEIINNYHEII